ncbi:E3 ubiquitin-protein ligase RNF31-like [Megalops cyprinoides]|uniref:E3 ubiquitin-protein ligase RNF31-like n=1 Tax=Megalops cyprinoides TaxID=118141 RepID=UPI001863A121|nr:E3 ubiquitin-protein ligase RNF31-like [Megalops cyprinoides]
MASISAQLEEVRGRAEACLSSTGSAQEAKSHVQAMADIPLPISAKYQHIPVETMVRENSTGGNREESVNTLQKLLTALNILEKYGCNLTNPNRPKYWRSVKHNNPVFRTTVDAIKGGRDVLCLYGYTNQQPDGLSFPDDVTDPDVAKVSKVAVEVMSLRIELDMFIKDTHPHPEFFERIIHSHSQKGAPFDQGDFKLPSKSEALNPSAGQQEEVETQIVVSPSLPDKPAQSPGPIHPSLSPTSLMGVTCSVCGGDPSLLCPPCGSTLFCETCDFIYHRHPDRTSHRREHIQAPKPDCTICGSNPASAHCPTCVQQLCLHCDRLYHSHPDRKDHHRVFTTPAVPQPPISRSLSTWQCATCTTINEVKAVLCSSCERPRLISAAPAVQEEPAQPATITEWQCKSCTVMNAGSSVLCEVCERPRLATRPPAAPVCSAPSTPKADRGADVQWTCQFCTYVNASPSATCEMCELARSDLVPSPARLPPPLSATDFVPPLVRPEVPPRTDPDFNKQKLMKDDGLKLIQLIREGEKNGVSPEEVYAALCVSRGSNVSPCHWLKSELPLLLDEICAMAASVQADYKTENSGSLDNPEEPQNSAAQVQLSRAEAKQAWLAAGGDIEKAVQQLLRNRRAKVRELCSLGFSEVAKCEEALRLSGGEVQGALSLLQRPLLEPFHQRVWSDQQEPRIDIKNPDKQRMCRRLLALYDLPSWGRCELALSLLQEPDAHYTLEDVVQAVKESQDRDFIKRMLAKECPCCLDVFPHSKMQSLTSCQCYVCCDCFQQHFTVAVRDKHIRDMVCAVCGGPDINDSEHLDSHFSTLDIQLRDCLEPEVYELFHKKLTEYALIKDPKFLWCTHCSYGFIYDADQLKVTCPQCRKSFCAQCKKPWESQHQGLSCEQFQMWKRENDPEYQRQGLAGYLRDNGITCPNCRFQYALTKGGCMHFTCSQCRYQFCSGCNNPFHTTACAVAQCTVTGLHAHHPRDCLFYMRDWEPARLQDLLQRNAVEFNTDPPSGTGVEAGRCGVMEQKDGGQIDSPCGVETQPGQAGLCEKHYREYLVSLINDHSLDPAPLFDENELLVACRRYQVDMRRGEAEDDGAYHGRLLKKLMDEVPLGDKVPRKK